MSRSILLVEWNKIRLIFLKKGVKKEQKKKKKIQAMPKGRQGFTLIEVVLVLVLVGGSFLALYGIFGKTVINDEESSYEMVASNLAQEGVEIVRNRRDRNALSGDPINNGLAEGSCFPFWVPNGTPVCNNTRRAEVERYDPGSEHMNCPAAGCHVSNYKTTIYTRECFIENIENNGEGSFAVSCVVKWEGISGIQRQTRAMAILTDWQSN